MRGRNRLKAEMSPYFRKEIAEPGILLEYRHGFEEMILLNKAYAKMLLQQKIISIEEARTILEGLDYVRDHFTEQDIDGKYEELYFNLEQKFLEKVGIAVGGRLHTGRSRNDIYATLWRMETRKSIWALCAEIIALQRRMLELAREYRICIMTGYTHMQPAQPITVGYYYTAAIEALGRDFDRLREAYERTNQETLGAAALAGTGFPIDRKALEEMLGFEGIVDNAMDCVGNKDYLLETESAIAILMVHLSRFAQDHYIWCTNEFGYAEVGGEIAIVSSIMPQKKNPVTLEMVKAKAANMMGAFVSGCAITKNTLFSLCMDLFEMHAAYWPAWESSRDALRLFHETLKHFTFHKERMYEAAKSNFSTVTELADFLVRKHNISFSEAHDIVADMVNVLAESQKEITEMNAALLKQSSEQVIGKALEATDDEIWTVLDPYLNVCGKTSLGSPGEESLRQMLEASDAMIREQESWLEKRQEYVRRAYESIEKQI